MHEKEHLSSALVWLRCRRAAVPLVLLSFLLLMAVQRPPSLTADSNHSLSDSSTPTKQRNVEQYVFQIAILIAVSRIAPPIHRHGELDCADVIFLATDLAFPCASRPPPAA